MHPVFFEMSVPEFLQGLLPQTLTIFGYGFMIATGAAAAFLFMSWQARKHFELPVHKAADLTIILLVAGFVGGKLLFYLEDPGYYLADPARMLQNPGKGFVFYGSLLFCIPAMLWYLRAQKLPVLPMLDIMAVTTCIVHGFGRLGCFMAGCCYGLPHQGFPSVTFTHEASLAKPLGEALHPTQLYSISMIASLGLLLVYLKDRKQFHGQLFIIYVALYAVGRSIIEMFRGDVQRGFIIEDLLSHSQFIALLMLAGAAWFYRKLYLQQLQAGKQQKAKA